ncbi:MAG: protein kinase [Polyangiaceae bacterium]|nr:protein kinase [Polyangiaceae bacterium]
MRSPGDTVARYTVVALLGRGGMGEVYEAEDTLLKRRVALKLLPAGGDHEARVRMMREARSAAAFEHPNVVTLFDAGIVGEGTPEEQTYIAMELVRGTTLRARVGDLSVPLARRVRWLVDAASALGAAHKAGLVHRDVKPDNVMLKEDGRIKVLDFGVAKRQDASVDASAPTEVPSQSDPSLTGRGGFVGTPRYASPEQLRGEPLDGRSDQYAWAVMAYELVSGKAPFDAPDGVALLSRILSTEAAPLSTLVEGIPAALDAVIHKALSKAPADRFASFEEIQERLEPLAEGAATTDAGRTVIAAPTGTRTSRAVVKTAKGVAWVFFVIAAALGTLIIGAIVVGAFMGKLHIDSGKSSASASSSAAPPPPLAVVGLRCAPAAVEGPGATPEIGLALGVGACARVATATGHLWAHEGARGPKTQLDALTPVVVSAKLGATVAVTVRVGDVEAEGTGGTPMSAMVAAADALAQKVEPRALSEADRKAWGAADDASARRIERAWRRLFLGDVVDPVTEMRALVASDGASPWPHAMSCIAEPRGSVPMVEACKATLARVDKLPPSREKTLRALALLLGQSDRSEEAIRLFRQSFRDAPDDPDVGGLYGAIILDTSADEGFGVIDGVAERFPSYALLPLSNAITANPIRDAQRNATYLARLAEILPEKACDDVAFHELLIDVKLEQARARLATCNALYGKSDPTFVSLVLEAELELASLEPDKARAIAQRGLSDEREGIRTHAMHQIIASHVIAGRVEEALAALTTEMEKQRDQQSPRLAMQRAIAKLRLIRALGRPQDPKLVKFIRQMLSEDAAAPASLRTRVEAILAVSGDTTTPRQDVAAAVIASPAWGDVFYAIPLLRAVHGDAKTRKLLEERKAPTRTSIVAALDYADLLVAVRAPDAEIEAQLKLAMIPLALDVTAIDKLIARLRLAHLYDKLKRPEEAAKLRAEVDRAWKAADPKAREELDRASR